MATTIPLGTGTARAEAAPPRATPAAKTRLQNIDALRGFVMVLMLLDHLRETWFLYVPVADPIDARTVLPAIGFARFAVSFCAPIFVALTGLGAYLFSINHTANETTEFLVKRGALLMVIEIVFLSPLYWGVVPQPTFWLQVIWCIGLCMILLAGLKRLPPAVLIAIGLALVCLHNLLDPIRLSPGDTFFAPWAMLHQRDAIALPLGFVAKTTYPILPWLGVILLGFSVGAWFAPEVSAQTRQRRLLILGFGMIAAFVALRLLNVYGDKPYFVVEGDPLRTFISFISLTKYPPSLLFLLPTLGGGALLLVLFERIGNLGVVSALAVFGGAPMFFYMLHLAVLRVLYHGALAIWGPNHGDAFGVSNYNWVLVWYVLMIVPLYVPTAWYSRLKRRRRDIAWLKYF